MATASTQGERTTDHPGSFHGPNGSRPRPANPQGTPERRKRIDLRGLRVAVANTWAAVVRVFGLVWSTSRSLTLGLGGATLAQSVIPVAQVWLAGALIDEVVDGIQSGAGDDHIRPVAILAGLQLLLFLAGSLFQTLGNITQQLLQERLSIHVQLLIMEHANTLDLADFENAAYYDQLQQAQRESANRPVQMVSSVFALARTTITFATMVGLLVTLSPWVAVAAILSPIPAFISGSRYGWWGFQLMRRQSPTRRLLTYLTSLLTTDSFNKEITLFTLGDHFISRYRTLSNDYYEETRTLLVKRYLAGFAWGSLTIAASSATFLYVAVLALRQTITIGALTVFTQAVAQVQSAFQGILGGVQGIYEHGLYLSTLYDLLDRSPKIDAPANPIPVRRPFQQGIEFQHVTYRYPGKEEPALSDVSFTIQPGETVALVGRNGAGKSTIVKLLGRLYDPSEGRVLIDGHDVREYDPTELRREFGMMFQDYAAYQLSARENIGVGNVDRVDDLDAVADAAERSGADAVIRSLPKGFETNLGKWFDEGHQLSGGEWQKVALARAFMRDAQILILDEPTAALDAEAEHQLFERIRELAAGKMAIFISHRFSTARKADKILVVDDGRLIESGTHEELVALGGEYAQLFELQAASYR